jgi:hypothetical protein
MTNKTTDANTWNLCPVHAQSHNKDRDQSKLVGDTLVWLELSVDIRPSRVFQFLQVY